MRAERYRVRLMFEWGGGCLWCGNNIARDKFSVGPIEERLPLSNEVQAMLNELSQWHDTSLNWDYPPDPALGVQTITQDLTRPPLSY